MPLSKSIYSFPVISELWRLFVTNPVGCFGSFYLLGCFVLWSPDGFLFIGPGTEEAQRGLPRKMNNQPGGTPN